MLNKLESLKVAKLKDENLVEYGGEDGVKDAGKNGGKIE